MSPEACYELWHNLLYRGAQRQPGQRIGVALAPDDWRDDPRTDRARA